MVTEFELEYQTHVLTHFRAFIRYKTLEKGKHEPQKAFKRWWIARAPTRLSMRNDQGKVENMLPRLRVDVWNKIKETL